MKSTLNLCIILLIAISINAGSWKAEMEKTVDILKNCEPKCQLLSDCNVKCSPALDQWRLAVDELSKEILQVDSMTWTVGDSKERVPSVCEVYNKNDRSKNLKNPRIVLTSYDQMQKHIHCLENQLRNATWARLTQSKHNTKEDALKLIEVWQKTSGLLKEIPWPLNQEPRDQNQWYTT